MTTSLASIRGRLGAYTMHSRHSAVETTAKARASFLASFEALVDPRHELPVAERLRRAEAARKAHFVRLALLSVKARRGRENGEGQ